MINTSNITKTSGYKFVIVPRLLAGLPLLGFGAMHFVQPEHFREILIASGIPMVEVNLYAAPVAITLGGVLLLLGFYARLGGLLGISSMVVAIYSTFVLANLTPDNLLGGLTEVPFVPPLPLPIVVTIASFVVVALGGGAWSLDWKNQSKQAAED